MKRGKLRLHTYVLYNLDCAIHKKKPHIPKGMRGFFAMETYYLLVTFQPCVRPTYSATRGLNKLRIAYLHSV